MRKNYLQYGIVLLATVIAGCWFTSCDGVRQQRYGVIFSEEQKERIDKEMHHMSDAQLVLASKITSTDIHDSIFLQSMFANRIMSSRMRRVANFQKAIDYGREAYSKAVVLGDTVEIVRMLNELGTNFRRVGALSDALEYHYKALAISVSFSDKDGVRNKTNMTYAYNGIGNIALSMHNNDEAKRCFQLGIKLEEEIDSKLGLAINFANLGSIMQDECKYDSALYYYERSYEMNKLCGSSLGVALCENHFGSLFEMQQLLDSARVHYQKGYKILTSSSDRWHWLVSCVSLGRVLLKMGNLKEAEQYLLSARDIAQTADATESLEEAHSLLAELYRKRGDFKKALDEVAKSQELNEAIRRDMQTSTFNNARLGYIKEKELREVAAMNDRKLFEAEQRKSWMIISWVVLAIVVVIAIQLYFTIRLVRRRNQTLKDTNEDKNKVFSVLSSEMKVPALEQRDTLRYIIENQDELTPQEQREYLIQAYGSSVRQVDQLSNLFTWSHIKLGDTTPNMTSVNLCQVVTEAIDILYLSAKQKNISFALPYDNGLMVTADSEMLMCIVLNLISNAIKFSYSGGEICIKYKEDAFAVMLFIEDHGVGMDEHQLSSILKNSELDRTVDLENIQGLGLPICVALAKKINGALSAESRLHRGSTFILTMQKST